MEAKIIEGTSHSPSIVLDAENNKFEFAGQSLPENVAVFYKPVFDWLDEYAKNPNDQSRVVFKMEYFNTASSKMIYEVLERFNEMYHNGKDIVIEWHFDEEDEDMEEAGEEYSEMVDVPFELKSYKVKT